MSKFDVKSAIKIIVVDFDGTISNTPLDFYRMRQMVREAIIDYIDIPKERSKTIMLLEEIAQRAEKYDADTIKKIFDLTEKAIIKVELEAATKAQLFPHVREIMKIGEDKGIKFGIITRNCREAINIVFPDAEEYVKSIVTRQDVEKVKPEPEHLLEALRQMDAKLENTLMVGDHPSDIITGKRAGSFTAAVGTGEGSEADLKAHKPDFYAEDFTKLAVTLGLWK